MSSPDPLHMADAARPPLIELDRASVIRGQVRVLHELSLRIEQGGHTAILGPNGCGKSTFIQVMTRQLYPLAHGDGRAPVRMKSCVLVPRHRLRPMPQSRRRRPSALNRSAAKAAHRCGKAS